MHAQEPLIAGKGAPVEVQGGTSAHYFALQGSGEVRGQCPVMIVRAPTCSCHFSSVQVGLPVEDSASLHTEHAG